MNNDLFKEFIIFERARHWLEQNPERLTEQEKIKFKTELMDYLYKKSNVLTDEVFDFLVAEKLISNETRHDQFAKYLKAKYPDLGLYHILDVGAGRMCHLSEKLGGMGASVVAMDPNIRLTDSESKAKKIMSIKKQLFVCADHAKDGLGTQITMKDLIVGLEPCMATEHIIRQCTQEDRPFEISLCYQNHPTLSGKIMRTPEDWYSYLKSISGYIDISKVEDAYIATNNARIIKNEKELLPDELEI